MEGGSSGGGGGGAGEVWTEAVMRLLEESLEETSDELVTTHLALRNVVKLSRMADCSPDKVEEYRRLLDECSVLTPYQLPPELADIDGLDGEQGVPDLVHLMLESMRDLNTAKTALRKMMELLSDPSVPLANLERYATVIESTVLAPEAPEE